MSAIEVKSFSSAEDVNNSFDNALVEAVKVGGQRVVRLTLQPGWHWSHNVKPVVGTESCQAGHLGVIISGTVCCKHDDGSEVSYTAGDAYAIEPGHDAWVVGDEVAVAFEFAGMWGE